MHDIYMTFIFIYIRKIVCGYCPKEQTKEQESRLTPYQKKLYSNLRKTSNIYRREANQIEAQLRRDEEEKKQRSDDEKRAEELSLPLKHWEKILSGKIIHMPEGDQMGNWHADRIRKKRIINRFLKTWKEANSGFCEVRTGLRFRASQTQNASATNARASSCRVR